MILITFKLQINHCITLYVIIYISSIILKLKESRMGDKKIIVLYYSDMDISETLMSMEFKMDKLKVMRNVIRRYS